MSIIHMLWDGFFPSVSDSRVQRKPSARENSPFVLRCHGLRVSLLVKRALDIDFALVALSSVHKVCDVRKSLDGTDQ